MNCLLDPLVLEPGTYSIKAGISSNNTPDIVFKNAIGKYNGRFDAKATKKFNQILFGDEIKDDYLNYDVSYPMIDGIIEKTDDEIKVFNYIYKRLNLNSRDHPVLVCQPISNSNDKKIYEIFFETFNVPYVQIVPEPILILNAEGLVSGLSVISGHCSTDITPIYENAIIKEKSIHIDFGGRDITENLYKSLSYVFHYHSMYDISVCNAIKENYCFISNNLKKDEKLCNETNSFNITYKTKNDLIKISRERFLAPEIWFNDISSKLEFGDQRLGIQHLVFNTVMNTDKAYHDVFFENIAFSGGNTLFPGFTQRFRYELKELIIKNIYGGQRRDRQKNLIEPLQEDFFYTKYKTFLGGCAAANLNKDKLETWISSDSYNEYGSERFIRDYSKLND